MYNNRYKVLYIYHLLSSKLLEKKARRAFVIIIKEVVAELGFAGRLFIVATAARMNKGVL